MSIATYRPGLALTLAHEGGYSNHPLDPGGATMKGVTQRVYDAYRRTKGLPTRSVKLIEPHELEAIYKLQYWNLVRGDDMPAGLDYALFDFAVNSGVSRANKFLQRGLGFVGDDIDGILGMRTMARVYEAAKQNEELLVTKLCEDRLKFVQGLSTFSTFGKGWTRRIMGDKMGAQPNTDKGVIDYGVAFAQRDPIYIMPKAIGEVQGEVPAKAIGPVSYNDAIQAGWGL